MQGGLHREKSKEYSNICIEQPDLNHINKCDSGIAFKQPSHQLLYSTFKMDSLSKQKTKAKVQSAKKVDGDKRRELRWDEECDLSLLSLQLH